MSKNHKIRQIADKLPAVPKLHPTTNQIQYDGRGQVIMLNHFREISKIYDENEGNDELIKFLCAKYMEAVYRYDENRTAYLRGVKRKKQIVLASEIALVILITAALVKIIWPY